MTKTGINLRIIARIIGFLLLLEAGVLLLVALVPLLYREQDFLFFLISSGITLTSGLLLLLWGRRAQVAFGKKEGFLTVCLVWVVFSIFGMFPFWLSGSIPSLTDAFFETMSGFSTTGVTGLTNVESLSHGMLLWRSLTNWLGGMGIIVLSVAILPMMGIGG
ncbi:MAG: TrkH family potassium uptake protein, partial [Prevotellaceae bacterium]|nr:TrkH family potassium uptake protein [Prevotellaceae bacterium]